MMRPLLSPLDQTEEFSYEENYTRAQQGEADAINSATDWKRCFSDPALESDFADWHCSMVNSNKLKIIFRFATAFVSLSLCLLYGSALRMSAVQIGVIGSACVVSIAPMCCILGGKQYHPWVPKAIIIKEVALLTVWVTACFYDGNSKRLDRFVQRMTSSEISGTSANADFISAMFLWCSTIALMFNSYVNIPLQLY
jgi:hypothetical protein